MSVLIWVMMVALGVFGSVGPDAASATSTVTSPAPATAPAALPGARAESRALAARFAEREALPPCGMVDVTASSPGRPRPELSPPGRAWRCLQDAVGVRGAELVTIDVRRGGVALHTFYRARPDGMLEVWTQRTRTSPGELRSRWSYLECTPSEDVSTQPCAV